MNEHPSQHREGLDHIYGILNDKMTPTRAIVDASRLSKIPVGKALKLAKTAGVARGDGNGSWSREKMTRTAFRDAIVRQWFVENVPCTNTAAVAAFAGLMSRSQLYYSVARLRKDESLTATRDGTRTPVYTVVEKEVAA